MKMKKVFLTAVYVTLLFMSAVGSVCTAENQSNILDMTYSYDGDTIYWPNASSFKLTTIPGNDPKRGYSYAPIFMPPRNTVGPMPTRHFTLQKTGALLIKFPLREWIGPSDKDRRDKTMRPR